MVKSNPLKGIPMFELIGDFKDLNNVDSVEELNDLLDTIEAAGGDIKEKIRAYRFVIKEKLAGAESVKALAASYTKRAQSLTGIATRLKGVIHEALEAIDEKKVEFDEGMVYLVKRAGALQIFDETLVPLKYSTMSVAYDKAQIKEDIKKGVDVPGASIEADKFSLTVK